MAPWQYRIARLRRFLAGGALLLTGVAIDPAGAQESGTVERKLWPITNNSFLVPPGWDERVWLSMGSLWKLESNDTNHEAGRLMPSFDWRGSRLIGGGGSTCGPMGSRVQPIYQVSGVLTPPVRDRKSQSYSRFAVLDNRLVVTVRKARRGCPPVSKDAETLFPLAARFELGRLDFDRIGLMVGQDRIDYQRDDKFAPYTGTAWRIESVAGTDRTGEQCNPLRIGYDGTVRFRCCNTVTTRLKIDDDGVLKTSPVRKTKVGCKPDAEPNLMDNAVASVLRGTLALDAEGRLVATGKYEPRTVRFTPEAWIAPLEGDWTLTSMRRIFTTTLSANVPAPEAEADGLASLGITLRVQGDSLDFRACDTRSATIAMQRGGAVRIGDVSVADTDAACLTSSGGKVMIHRTVRYLLEKDATLSIASDRDEDGAIDTLTLTRASPDSMISYVFGRAP